MKLVIVFCALLAAALAEGQFKAAYFPPATEFSDDPSLRVVGGQNAARNQFPYQVSLQRRPLLFFSHICGGSIISARWILTAAHCTTFAVTSLRVVAGILLLNEGDVPGQQIRSVAQIINHEKYPGGNVVAPYDISLVRLESELTINNAVQIIGIPQAGHQSLGIGVLSGWGLLSTGGTASNHLQYVAVPVVPDIPCDNHLTSLVGRHPFNPEVNICSGTVLGNESACNGDSGGPYVKNNKVIGVVSWGITPCGVAGGPSVYSKTSAFVSWITQNTNGEVRPEHF